MENQETGVLSGKEVLILMGDEVHRRLLRELLVETGLKVTATGDAAWALERVQERTFLVAVVDQNTPEPGEGLVMLQAIREVSPSSKLILLTAEPTFEGAVAGFEAGAAKVHALRPETPEEVVASVIELCLAADNRLQQPDLMGDTLEFMEKFLRLLMDASRRAMQAEDKASGDSARWDIQECLILVVDENPKTAPGLQQAMGSDGAYRVISALSGGEALDYASRYEFQIALIKEDLPDLPGTMVARSLTDLHTGGLILTFSDRGSEPGTVSLVEESGVTPLITRLERAQQLVDQLRSLRDVYNARRREQRHLASFRTDYYDFLQQYVQLRHRLVALQKQEGS